MTQGLPIDLKRRNLLIGAAAGVAAGAAGVLLPGSRALASAYPERPITFICPWPVGGTADQSMRALCQVAGGILKQSIVVENRAGASGMIGTKALARATPDGYTIGQIPISVTRFAQLGMLQLDPRTELTYLARTSGQTFGIAVPTGSPYKTLQDVVAAAKANPGKITYAHAGIGGATHVGMEQFALAAGVQFNAIAYKGGAAALQDVLAGQVELLADSSSWAPHVEAGKLRLLATWGEQRASRFKDTPTLKELGYNVVVEAPNGIGAPKGLPPAVEKTLRDAFRAAVASNEFKQVAARLDAPLMYLDGPDYKKYVASVYAQETELIKRLKLKELLQQS
ncbi:tripartite tricarboxylate transporter substrate binding protein [Cupriavidus oxalaticus]|uniref:TctC n=1 Tax=Cupriavidus oxalaticus TaxID=96344 RepID=A0A976GDT5_9BURK|nr:tripartite tricarboxylate transporter substrate binding protein [Cupriavidus oxalaticus]QRQ83615.1 tripartite tricarboxylate transporter substrate binding protein [Cupriavidus oxalaticus]QRQ92296.1 tripartite tricarboxylate transporter substrate binding protein [Cupriavidus oxalaticus]WQD86906.1 tripartite tricarboxylate transporter substrate binding protein [Cupriavidus oxalaticus]SPC24980.1 TctC [Cupriavidus oxalaticus]